MQQQQDTSQQQSLLQKLDENIQPQLTNNNNESQHQETTVKTEEINSGKLFDPVSAQQLTEYAQILNSFNSQPIRNNEIKHEENKETKENEPNNDPPSTPTQSLVLPLDSPSKSKALTSIKLQPIPLPEQNNNADNHDEEASMSPYNSEDDDENEGFSYDNNDSGNDEEDNYNENDNEDYQDNDSNGEDDYDNQDDDDDYQEEQTQQKATNKTKRKYVFYDDEEDFKTFGSDDDELSYDDDDDDDDYEEKPSKSKKSRRKKNYDEDFEYEEEEDFDSFEEEEEEGDDDDDSEDDDDSDSDYGSSKKKRKTRKTTKKKGKGRKKKGKPRNEFEDDFGVPIRVSLRNKERKSYKEYGEDEDLDEEERKELRKAQKAAEVFDGDSVEHIIKHRMRIKKLNEEGEEVKEEEEHEIEDTGMEVEEDGIQRPEMPKDPESVNWEEDVEYLVKWKGWAVIHNSWGSYNYLSQFNGFKKVISYIKLTKQKMLIRMNATAEEIEQLDIQDELELAEYDEAKNVERIVAMKRIKPTQDNPHKVTYFVKWCGMPYSECTWENPDDIKNFQYEIDDFLQRNERYIYAPRVPKPFKFVKLEKQPEWLGGGVLRDYQLEGLNWLTYCYCHGTNGILADEMGLGKTVQTISFLERLVEDYNVFGPFLVVVPLSTLPNWAKEFRKWAPRMNVIMYCGNGASRKVIQQYEFHGQSNKIKFNVLLTTYEIVMKDKSVLNAFKWKSLVVDEAHRLKNSDSLLYRVLMEFKTDGRMLITGTPLQNSLKELWALLHFLMPESFPDCASFEALYEDLKHHDCIKRLHDELRPYILRRLKRDVEKSLPQKREQILRVAASPLQRKYYRWVIARNFRELNRGVRGEGKTTLLNVVAELKKVCNHPYLFPSAEQAALAASANTTQDIVLQGLVRNSGKMQLLDKLLERLKETGHRVLIFSQMVRMLDVLSDYLKMKNWPFQRLDGSTPREMRQKAMDHFNAENSPDFCFILSTRAGGLGINLATADTVIIFDSDWNPQNDLQAEARCHRIGQEKTVNIYRLLVSNSVEENILRSAKRKMVLDQLVIQSMDTTAAGILNQAKGEDGGSSETGNSGEKSEVAATAEWIASGSNVSGSEYSKEELDAIIKFGAEDIFKDDEQQQGQGQNYEIDIDKILERAEVVNGNTETPAEELLNTFKVTSFGGGGGDSTDDFWSKLITSDVQAETDEIERLNKRRYQDEGSDSDERDRAAAVAAALQAVARAEAKKDSRKRNGKKGGAVEEREVKALHRGLRMFGDPELIDDIIDSNKSALGTQNKETLKKVANEILEAARASVENGSADSSRDSKGEEKKEDESGGDKAGKKEKRMTKYKGFEFDAAELLERVSSVNFLRSVVSEYKDNLLAFRVTNPLKPPVWGKISWSSKDDSMLMLGVYRHGYGNWSKITADPDLALQKIANTQVGNTHLTRRIEALLRSIHSEQAKSSPSRRQKAAPQAKGEKLASQKRPLSSKRRGKEKDDDDDDEDDDDEIEEDEEDDFEDTKRKSNRVAKKGTKKALKIEKPPPPKKAKREEKEDEKKKKKANDKEDEMEARRKRISEFVPEQWDLFWRKTIPPKDKRKDAKAQKKFLENKSECFKVLKPVMSEVNKIKYFKVNVESSIDFAISKTVKYLRIIGAHIKKLGVDCAMEDALWYHVANSTYRDMAFIKDLYKNIENGTAEPPTEKLKSITASVKKELGTTKK